jgi:hypothetical protein
MCISSSHHGTKEHEMNTVEITVQDKTQAFAISEVFEWARQLSRAATEIEQSMAKIQELLRQGQGVREGFLTGRMVEMGKLQSRLETSRNFAFHVDLTENQVSAAIVGAAVPSTWLDLKIAE